MHHRTQPCHAQGGLLQGNARSNADLRGGKRQRRRQATSRLATATPLGAVVSPSAAGPRVTGWFSDGGSQGFRRGRGPGRAEGFWMSQKSKPPLREQRGFGGKAPGDDLLSHGLSHTTIGAAAFHFRVRDGIGWFHSANFTRERVGGSLSVGAG